MINYSSSDLAKSVNRQVSRLLTAPHTSQLLWWVFWLLLIGGIHQTQGAADLFIRDTPADNGGEPNPDPGPMWVSQDIWVRNNPDPGWRPQPFAAGTPPWTVPPHQNPEYRNPILSVPCYVYVYITNQGSSASTGNERLRLFWAKASTGLSWPTHWSNYLASTCSPGSLKLYGQEITKPRKNAADATPDEITRFINALNSIDGAPHQYPDGVTYWDKQSQVHNSAPEHSLNSFFTGMPIHSHNPAFLPWHREFISRLEILLQQAEPTVTLLYWDWTTDPRTTPNSVGTAVNLFGNAFGSGSFMGASGGVVAGVDTALVPIGPPFAALTPQPRRRTKTGTPASNTTGFASDATLLLLPYHGLSGSGLMATMEFRSHNPSHTYFGSGSDMEVNTSPRDPFFFLLHANADRIWAAWQRDPAHLGRLESATAYGDDATHCIITSPMRPWKGPTMHCRAGADPLIAPWSAGSEHRLEKLPTHPSVVSPPIYDKVPLTIPPLQAGESVIMQIPWYPPNRANFSCFADIGHFCLLARIEGDTATFETSDVFQLAKRNNGVAWKNISIVDDFTGQGAAASLIAATPAPVGGPPPAGFYAPSTLLVGNPYSNAVTAKLAFTTPGNPQAPSIFDYGRITVDLKGELFRRWEQGGFVGQGFERVGSTAIQLFTRDASIGNIPLNPSETFIIEARFDLNPSYPNPAGQTFDWDFIQCGAPGNPNTVVGGNRFTIDFNKICLIKAGSAWRYLDAGGDPGVDWVFPGYDDSNWKSGKAELGFGDPVTFFIENEVGTNQLITAYFRHSFNLSDPSLVQRLVLQVKRDDGAVVYLNGKEVYRANLPNAGVTAYTYATANVEGVAEEAYYPVEIANPASRLFPGMNLVAVEVHQAFTTNGTPDLRFDLELCANPALNEYKPYIGFADLPAGMLYQVGQPIVLNADTLDVDGDVRAVEFFQDGASIAFFGSPPFRHVIPFLAVGSYRFSAVAYDDAGLSSEAHVQLTVVSNLLPQIEMTSPIEHTFVEGTPITLTADASDSGGTIESVEFFVNSSQIFGARADSLGLLAAPPYKVIVDHLAAGMHLLTAVAKDNRGAYSQAPALHIEVIALRLHIARQGELVIITWDDPDAILECAFNVNGPWSPVTGAASPYRVVANDKYRFYRLRLDVHPHGG